MHIEINLASQPFEDAQRFLRQWTLTLGIVSLLTLALVIGAVLRLRVWTAEEHRIDILQGQIAQGDREIAQAEAFLNRPENRDTRDKSLILNDLIVRKAFSWTEVFSDLERIMPPRLHVVSIRPELTPDNQLALRMVVAGESRERALDLVRRMEQSPHFHQPQIVAEATEQQPQNPGDNVQFDISTLYVAEGQRNANQPAAAASTEAGGSATRGGF
ncbi:MAG TPA: PilN domain-containing protein [Terriglobales bacterium]|nr:PilN domain-containing protein [Terriglobales bacterium]